MNLGQKQLQRACFRAATYAGLALACAAGGCAGASHPPGLAYVSRIDERGPNWMPSRRGQLSLAQEFAGRSAWPALDDGYQVDVYNEAFEFRVDDQSFYDTLGGGFFQSGEALRQRITIR